MSNKFSVSKKENDKLIQLTPEGAMNQSMLSLFEYVESVTTLHTSPLTPGHQDVSKQGLLVGHELLELDVT